MNFRVLEKICYTYLGYLFIYLFIVICIHIVLSTIGLGLSWVCLLPKKKKKNRFGN
jgi:hypothetical protein